MGNQQSITYDDGGGNIFFDNDGYPYYDQDCHIPYDDWDDPFISDSSGLLGDFDLTNLEYCFSINSQQKNASANKNIQIPGKKQPQGKLLLGQRSGSSKRVSLSDDAKDLKNRLYSIFTFKKVFKKQYTIRIVNEIVVPNLSPMFPGIKKVTREEEREIGLYFVHYARYKNEILKCLEDNKKQIMDTILIDLDKKKL